MNRNSAGMRLPLYHQIKLRLLEAIESGHLQPGDRVPSERELTEKFAVSRMTARQSLTQLESEGYLSRVQGKGTFVAVPKLEQPLLQLTGFTEDMRRRGLTPGGQILDLSETQAGRRVGKALGIAETAPVCRLERLRFASGEPLAIETAHVRSDFCPGLIDQPLHDRSLYTLLYEQYGLVLSSATQSLEAVPAGEYEAYLLKVRVGSPLLLMERQARDQSERPVEFVRSVYRGDRYRFTTELLRREDVEA